MVVAASARIMSSHVLRELETCAQRIQNGMAALWLWEQVLTKADRDRLGGQLEPNYRQYGTAGIWKKLRGVSTERAVIDVARECNLLSEQSHHRLLRQLGEIVENFEDVSQLANDSGDLVLVERPRTAFWAGSLIEVDWVKRPALWAFFWELSRLAKAGQPIDNTFLGASPHRAAVAKQKSRLLTHPDFPVELGDLIVPTGLGTQKLDIPPHRIRLFEIDAVESLREITA